MVDTAKHHEKGSVDPALLNEVLASFDGCTNERLKAIMRSLVTHLHQFVAEVQLTEQEWQAGIDFLTAAGHITDEHRSEWVLLSDTLGASMLVVGQNNPRIKDSTEATVFGPFYADSPKYELGEDIAGGAPGVPCWVSGTVKDTDGDSVGGAVLEMWESDADGLYDVQYSDGRHSGRGQVQADTDGNFRFWGVVPTAYPIPNDGPVGQMLGAVNRSPMRPPHLHFKVTAPGYRTLVTHIFVKDETTIGSDAVFGVKESLMKDFIVHQVSDATPVPHGRIFAQGVDEWAEARFDIVLPRADAA